MAQVLLVASSPKAESLFSSMLSESFSCEITCLHSVQDAWHTISEQAYSLILILSPLTDGNGYDLAKMASANTTAGVILVCRPEPYEEAAVRLKDCGVFVFSTARERKFSTLGWT